MKYIEAGSKGGFTGGKHGIRIYENGNIYDIKQYTYSSEVLLHLIKSKINVTGLFDLVTSNILRTNYVNPDNVSYYILYQHENIKQQEAKVHYWTFSYGNKPPSFLQNIYNKINEIQDISSNNNSLNNINNSRFNCVIL